MKSQIGGKCCNKAGVEHAPRRGKASKRTGAVVEYERRNEKWR